MKLSVQLKVCVHQAFGVSWLRKKLLGIVHEAASQKCCKQAAELSTTGGGRLELCCTLTAR